MLKGHVKRYSNKKHVPQFMIHTSPQNALIIQETNINKNALKLVLTF